MSVRARWLGVKVTMILGQKASAGSAGIARGRAGWIEAYRGGRQDSGAGRRSL